LLMRRDRGGTRGVDFFLSFWGDKWGDKKEREGGRASALSGRPQPNQLNNQPKTVPAMARPDGEVREARLLSACTFHLSFTSRSLRWLVVASHFVTLPPPCIARRTAISRSLNAWLHRRCPFRIAVAPSIAIAVALPSCHPSPPSLVDCCRFHRHRRVNIHPPLLPLRSLCCACHRRPSPSRHPSPPLLVDCCIFHVHCRIAVHYRRSVAPTITVNAVAVAMPSCCPCPSLLSLVDCCLAVGSHWGSKQ
jgi:hypothetical protein